MPYPQFDRTRLRLLPLATRQHDYGIDTLAQLDAPLPPCPDVRLPTLAARVAAARRQGSAVIWMMGAHAIKYGLSRYIIDLLRRGALSCLSLNGAGAIHDYELALVGATSESVARYIRTGQFGLWRETGRLNDLACQAAAEGIGLGEAIGREIWEQGLPHREVSLLGWAYHLGIATTVHVGIGNDIVHEHPNCDGAAWGAASYADLLVFAEQVRGLEGGAYLNIGTAVTGPEVYLKALSMARNVATQEGRDLCHFTTAVFDLQELGGDLAHEPGKDEARYYFRPFKTILVRTVADGGESFYIQAPHQQSIPTLWHHIALQMEAQA